MWVFLALWRCPLPKEGLYHRAQGFLPLLNSASFSVCRLMLLCINYYYYFYFYYKCCRKWLIFILFQVRRKNWKVCSKFRILWDAKHFWMMLVTLFSYALYKESLWNGPIVKRFVEEKLFFYLFLLKSLKILANLFLYTWRMWRGKRNSKERDRGRKLILNSSSSSLSPCHTKGMGPKPPFELKLNKKILYLYFFVFQSLVIGLFFKFDPLITTKSRKLKWNVKIILSEM